MSRGWPPRPGRRGGGKRGDPYMSSSAWQRQRRRVLTRDGGECQIAGPRCTGEATEVDHIVPRAEWTGADVDCHALANLRAVCHECHVDRRAAPPSRDWSGDDWTAG